MGNEGCAKVTCLSWSRDENRNQDPAEEPAPVQVSTITADNANHMERDIIVAAINHQMVDQADAAEPMSPIPPVVGNTNNPDLNRHACESLQHNASILGMIIH